MSFMNYSDDEVKNWLAGKSPAQIAEQAASMGLSQAQIQQALNIGGLGYSPNQITDYARGNGYNFGGANGAVQRWNANAGANLPKTSDVLPADYGFAQRMIAGNANNPNLDPNSPLSTGLGFGNRVTVQQVRDFAATNPTNDQILEQAAAHGMSLEELTTAMAYGRGDTYNTLPVNEMINGSSTYGYDTSGRIVALNGRGKSQQNGSSALSVYDPYASQGGPSGSGTVPTGTAGTVPQGPLTQIHQPNPNVTQPGTTVGNTPVAQYQPMNWGTGQVPPAQFQTPVLNALYNAQQQRMTTPAPNFNFQATATPTTPEPQGALTQAVQG